MKHTISIIFLCLTLLLVACQQGTDAQSNFETGTQNTDTESSQTQEEQRNVDLFGEVSDNIVTEYVPYGYLAKPNDGQAHPGVIMIHEWWGLNDNIKTMAKHLASKGYTVLAIDLYSGNVAQDAEQARAIVTQVRENQEFVTQDMRDAVKFLQEQEQVTKVASMGWCFGGGQSLNLALSGEELDATIIYYGSLSDNKEELSKINWPVLGIFGEEDSSISVESVNNFQNALNELGVQNQIYIYPGVGHAFANPSGSSFAQDETKDAWQKTVAFLDENLKN